MNIQDYKAENRNLSDILFMSGPTGLNLYLRPKAFLYFQIQLHMLITWEVRPLLGGYWKEQSRIGKQKTDKLGSFRNFIENSVSDSSIS